MADAPLVTWRDVLWLIHRYPLRWIVRFAPDHLLQPTERAAEWTFRVGRWHKRREAARKMVETLGISDADARRRASAMLRAAVQIPHVERRVAGARTLRDEPVRWIGRDQLDAALAKKKGVLLCVVHRFAVANLPRALAAEGYSVLTIVREMTRPTFGRVAARLSRRSERVMYDFLYPNRVLPDDVNATLKMTAHLRAGGIVMIAADAWRSQTSADVPFLKSETRLSWGVLELARLSGAPIVPCDPLYDDDGGLSIRCVPALDLTPAATRELFVERNLPNLVAVFESFISSSPDQWMRWADL